MVDPSKETWDTTATNNYDYDYGGDPEYEDEVVEPSAEMKLPEGSPRRALIFDIRPSEQSEILIIYDPCVRACERAPPNGGVFFIDDGITA